MERGCQTLALPPHPRPFSPKGRRENNYTGNVAASTVMPGPMVVDRVSFFI
jgi:hypothetical protein